jgi:hypothetical protein
MAISIIANSRRSTDDTGKESGGAIIVLNKFLAESDFKASSKFERCGALESGLLYPSLAAI